MLTGRSDQFTPNSNDQVVTERVWSVFSLSRTLLESTEHWPSASGHLISQRPVAPDENTLVK